MKLTSVIAIVLLSACGEAFQVERTTTVIQSLGLARESAPGVSVGFNIDSQVSTTLDSRTCNQEDFVDPSGKPGIDNQIARLMPLIDFAGQGAVDALVQASIGEGRLLVFVSVETQPESDTVSVIVERGEGKPLLGGDGLLLAGQTISRHAVPDLGRGEGTRQADGSILVGPFPVRLPVVVFTELYELEIAEAYVHLTPQEGGGYQAVLGGWSPIEEFLEIARKADPNGNQFEELFGEGIRGFADLQREKASGVCTAMSLAATFRTVPAFQF